jgi:tight adherence protein C
MSVALAAGTGVALAIVLALRPGPAVRPIAPREHTGLRSQRDDRPDRLRLRRRRRDAEIDRAMPDLLDLLVLALQAGLPPPMAFAAIAPHVPAAVGPAVRAVTERSLQGERFVESLDALVDRLGTRALALVAAIGSAERSGLPLAPTVDRLADDARAHRRRSAEIEARRLPVRLAVPLVCCTLPSFVCIAIGPVLIGALASLRSM